MGSCYFAYFGFIWFYGKIVHLAIFKKAYSILRVFKSCDYFYCSLLQSTKTNYYFLPAVSHRDSCY